MCKLMWLSSLRGLLVFLVFFSHQTYLDINNNLLFIIGRVGVAGFFLISGYLVVESLKRRNNKQFCLNRFFRIYPIFWILLTITFVLCWPNFSIFDYIANFTLFNEFVGVECIIGASWMLPIMILFFIFAAIQKRYKNMSIFFYTCSICAIIVGGIRMLTGKPFPTAIFLLIMVGALGYIHKTENSINRRILIKLLIFEFSLIIASIMSYGFKTLYYFIAYNIGFLLFYLFEKNNIYNTMLDKLGKLGFTFFLGADIPLQLIGLFLDVANWNPCCLFFIKFLFALIFAWIITNFVEDPMLRKGKQLEFLLA